MIKAATTMRVVFLTTLLCLFCAPLFAAPYEIEFKSGTILPAENSFIVPDLLPQFTVGAERVHVLLQLDRHLKSGDRERLKSSGIELLSYFPDRAYAASVPADISTSELARLRIRAVTPFYAEYKLHPRVVDGRLGEWSLMENGNRIFAVEIMSDVTLDEASKALISSGFLTGAHLDAAHTLLVACNESKLNELAGMDYVLFIEESPPPLQITNDVVRTRLHVNEVQAAPYNLSGAGVTILVFDGGMADNTHPDFAGRMTWSEEGAVLDHATHTSGTVGGSGAVTFAYRGMAPAVTLISGEYDECNPYCFYESPGDIEGDYLNARQLYNIELTTNSMGANINSNSLDCDWFGDYETTSRLLDGMVRNTDHEPLLMFWSAGNERNDNWCGVTSYGCMSIPAGAKNIITVGSTSTTDGLSSFSSTGPVDDGRIKPEIVATGEQVNSCFPGGGYGIMDGTSMSCPAAAGVACLILEQWHNMHPGAPDPLPETMKSLLINSATGFGSPGPDFQRGYGIVNAQRAIDNMIAGGLLESSLSVDENFSYTFTVEPGMTQLSISLAWSDFPASGNVIPTLVNDLDLVLTDPNDSDYLPWILNPSTPAVAATNGEDHVNICEQVQVANPTPGEWTLTVSGSVNAGDAQTFGIAANVPLVAEWTTVSGQITDAITTNSLPGRVSVVDGSQSVWTDSEGNYTLSVPRGATHNLLAESYGYVAVTTSLSATQESQILDFSLTTAQNGTINGSVTNQVGWFLRNAEVRFEFPQATIPPVMTNPVGAFTTQLPGGNTYIAIANYLGVEQSASVYVPENASATLDIVIQDNRINPSGPDDYGYYCYENTDLDLAPVYEYTSIMPSQGGAGTQVGPLTGNDWMSTVTLPFTVTYYGQAYTQVTISADGWVRMDTAVVDTGGFRNVSIPDADEPNGMICVFWDDLYPYHATAGGEIGYYYDSANGRFIIEYREVPQFNPTTNHVTAQLMIYNNETRPTVTGDNEFEIHFQRFDYYGNVDTDQDATIGIESPNGQDGLQMVFDGNYLPSCYEFDVGTALRFTTGLFTGAGAVAGQISTVPPLDDLSMFAINFGEYSTNANADGSFLVENVVSRLYRVTISAAGFETVQSELITVIADETTIVNFTNVYRLDPAGNLTGDFNPEIGRVELIWNQPAWAGGGTLDEFTSYQVNEQGAGLLGSTQDTVFSWEPPHIGVYNFWVTALYDGGTSVNSEIAHVIVMDADENQTALPTEFSLSQNFPNPFNPNTQIKFGLPVDSDVRLEVFDILGREVDVLAAGRLTAGFHQVEFNAARLGTGIYFYRLQAGEFVELRKMMLIR
jgi:hypothetical protein